jgi:putative glycosyl hydrolase-like family 15 (GHL15) protein
MRYRIGAALMCAAVLVPATAAQAATPNFAAGHVRVAISNGAATADFSQTVGRTRYVILQNDQRDRLRQIKAADPTTKVLLYKDLTGMTERSTSGTVASGVSTQEAESHPDWFLRNTDGQRFAFRGYPWISAADVGLRDYQNRWAQNVISQMKSEGWDGVFIDDANPTIQYHYEPAKVAKYPNDAQYGAATRSALATIGPAIRAAGKLAIPNMGAWRDYPEVVNDWLQFVDGGLDEQFTKWGGTGDVGYIDGYQWENQLAEVKAAERQGKVFLGVTQAATPDAAAARYGWATMLLAAQGHSYFALHNDYTNQNWFPDYDLPIGRPAGAEAARSDGIHRRAFTNGLVLVNPTTVSRTVSLGGLYSSPVLRNVSSVVMAPHSGLVLVKGSVAPAAPAAPALPAALPAASAVRPQPPVASAPAAVAATPAKPAAHKARKAKKARKGTHKPRKATRKYKRRAAAAARRRLAALRIRAQRRALAQRRLNSSRQLAARR